MENFKKYIKQYVNLKEENWQKISQYLTQKLIKKGEVILEQGKICKSVYFLEEGLLRFLVWKEGDDISKFFTIAPYFFTSQNSFNNQTASKESIEALEDSIIWEMKRENAYHLLKIESWSTFVRKITQEVQYNTEKILEELQNETAEERYKKMIEEKSVLLERASLKHLASYLGIAPQSLSRIRKKIMKKERT